MDAGEFTRRLGTLSAAEIERLAGDLRADAASADGEVGWWRATVAVSCALRRLRRTRLAGLAAHEAGATVVARATALALLERHHDDVTLVARAAADVVRGLVAGADVADHTRRLMAPWGSTLDTTLSAA